MELPFYVTADDPRPGKRRNTFDEAIDLAIALNKLLKLVESAARPLPEVQTVER
jgi:hypothetical protein